MIDNCPINHDLDSATMSQAMQTTLSFDSPLDLYRALRDVWAPDTASPTGVWSPSKPAQNHCSVTALVVNEVFGGDIFSTKTPGGTHFYNVIDGRLWDLTVSQFDEPISYDATPASRDTALADTSQEKFDLVKQRLAAHQAQGKA